VSQYVRRPRAYYEYWEDGTNPGRGTPLGTVVHEPPEDHLEETGLLDKDGNPLMRKLTRRPIGFGYAYECEEPQTRPGKSPPGIKPTKPSCIGSAIRRLMP
jgi:hypothetical protein